MATKIKVMIVDDSALVRQVITQAISRDPSIEVVATAQDPIFALEKLKTQWPDVIVLDIEMPRMDGLTLCRNIKEDPDLKYLPVALFSSIVNATLEHRGKSVGADAQFAKPDLQTLSEKVLELIAKGGMPPKAKAAP